MKVSVDVKIAGMKQKHHFETKEESTPFGTYELIVVPDNLEIPTIELLKIAEKKGMPVLHRGKKYFPPGKTSRDLAKK